MKKQLLKKKITLREALPYAMLVFGLTVILFGYLYTYYFSMFASVGFLVSAIILLILLLLKVFDKRGRT